MREVQKSLPPETLCAQQAADMAQINALAKREMTPEEVYTFSVRLCDNEIDRDGERFDAQTLRELAEETPLGRLGTPEDIAHAVAFFASDRADFLTGQVLSADGGFIV